MHTRDAGVPTGSNISCPAAELCKLKNCVSVFRGSEFSPGREERIREKVVNELPKLVRAQFPGNYGVVIKPVPEEHLPTYTFMAALACDQPIFDPSADYSILVLCWLGDIEMPLPELIEREISSVDWDKHALDRNL